MAQVRISNRNVAEYCLYACALACLFQICGGQDMEPSTDTPSKVHRGGKIPLYLGGYFPLGGGWDGSGFVVSSQMALDHINNNPNILEDYELRMVWNDTQVSSVFFLHICNN